MCLRSLAFPLVHHVPGNCHVAYKKTEVHRAWRAWARGWEQGRITPDVDAASLIGPVIYGPNPNRPVHLPNPPDFVDEGLAGANENVEQPVEENAAPPGLRTYAVTATTTTTTYYVPMDAPAYLFPLPHPQEAQAQGRAGPFPPRPLFVPRGGHH